MIKSIVDEMMTQDNRATSYPVFCVQRRADAFDEEGVPFVGWRTIQTFFTNKGIKQFLENYRNDYDEEIEFRVYVKSGYKNPEWKAVRDFLAASENKELPR